MPRRRPSTTASSSKPLTCSSSRSLQHRPPSTSAVSRWPRRRPTRPVASPPPSMAPSASSPTRHQTPAVLPLFTIAQPPGRSWTHVGV
eukprot:4736277-Prymnesium_polylepis.1